MLYCTYDQYAAAGGTVPETAFGVLCSRASRMIDAATFGRAEHHAAGCEACREALADACAQIVGLLAAAIIGQCRRCQRLQRRLQRHLWQQCQCDRGHPAGSL
mgnify:CR=1 FL=1